MRELNYDDVAKRLLTPRIVNLLSAIHEYKGKQELFFEAQPDILNAMLELAKIQSIGASNRIEGIFTSENRLNQLVKEKVEPKNRSERQIAGYREVLRTIHENYEYIPISPNIILQLHRDLYSYGATSIGGHWKNADNIIEEIDGSGEHRVRFKPVSAFETPMAMDILCEGFNKTMADGKFDDLLLIPMFILDFLCIHPFNDGNGRISRLLMLLLFYRSGYIVGKYISLEMIIEKSKETYYDVLGESSEDWHEGENSYQSFVEYSLGILLNAYKDFSGRVEHLKHRNLSKPERIKNIFITKVGKISKADIAILCPDISISTIETTLLALVKEGFIKKIGTGKSTVYIQSDK